MKRILALLTIIFCFAAFPVPSRCEDVFRVPIIYVQFSDLALHGSKETSDSLAKELSLYYDAQFGPQKKFSFEPVETVNIAHSYSYYGTNTTNKRDALIFRLVIAAVKAADEHTDFSQYDNDSDGNIDALIIVVPGISEALGGGQDMFWPQTNSLDADNASLTADGKRITQYSVVPELNADGAIAGIGTAAHEFGHLLGLQDMYDTDAEGSGGLHPGLGRNTALMDYGNLNDGGNTPPNLNAIDRHLLGIGKAVVLEEPGRYVLAPIDLEGEYGILPTGKPDCCFLMENRRSLGNDSFIGGEGMLIYRLDRSDSDAGYSTFFQRNLTAAERWRHNQVNCNPDFPCADLIRALPDSSDIRYAFWPQPGADCFAPSPLALTNISREYDGSISFVLLEPIRIEEIKAFQSSAIISWTISPQMNPVDSCKINWWSDSQSQREKIVRPSGPEAFSCTLDSLRHGSRYHFAIQLWCKGGSTFAATGQFSTLNYRSSIYRFIYFGDVSRNEDGSFPPGTRIPLIVYNAVEVEQTEWLFDGRPVRTEADGYWTIPGSGTLKARIHNADGSTDVIIKEITVR
ncbi:MAG: M6 family metalloprotease domain-containing protein [Bacteroidales bacterium]|nr:M6 family metalloprotease domain-containing protein [Bacteroidales bacterium]